MASPLLVVALVAALALVGARWARAHELRAEIALRFRRLARGEAPHAGSSAWFGRLRLVRLARLAVEPSARRHLAQAGWESPAASAALCGIRLAFSALLFAAVAVVRPPGGSLLGYAEIAGVSLLIVHVTSALWLQVRARERRERLRDDAVALVPLLGLCFEAGLSLERALAMLSGQGRHALPVLSSPLERVLRDSRSGRDAGQVLLETARELESRELHELAALLRQSEPCSAALREPLAALAQRLVEGRRFDLRTQASQRSAQLLLVLVCWLVPALLAGVTATRVFAQLLLPNLLP